LDHVTTALYEWGGLCEGEAESRYGKPSGPLKKVAKEMDAVLTSIGKQTRKAKVKLEKKASKEASA
jgi:hypothetical protein